MVFAAPAASSVTLALHRFVSVPQHHRDPALDEGAAQLLGDLGVESGQHLLFQFDHRHLGAEGLVEIRELQSHRARADHGHAFGQMVVQERFAAGHHAVANLHPAEQPLARAGGDQDAFGLDRRRGRRRFACRLAERDAIGPRDTRAGLEQVDLVLAQQEAHTLGEFVRRLAAALDHADEIDFHFADLDTVFLGGAANRLHRLGRVEQRLGRDTSPVEANTADFLALDHRDPHLELARADRRHVAAGAGTDYRQVVSCICQVRQALRMKLRNGKQPRRAVVEDDARRRDRSTANSNPRRSG
jgi:hypothetical protein